MTSSSVKIKGSLRPRDSRYRFSAGVRREGFWRSYCMSETCTMEEPFDFPRRGQDWIAAAILSRLRLPPRHTCQFGSCLQPAPAQIYRQRWAPQPYHEAAATTFPCKQDQCMSQRRGPYQADCKDLSNHQCHGPQSVRIFFTLNNKDGTNF